VRQYRFAVYNRWGNLVFQSNQPGSGWDGKVNGIAQNGVFVWTCIYQFTGEAVREVKGTVMLVK
jgi:gliding motility-associated-like protein